MAQSFENRLLDLLPPIYRTRDELGDLASFLRVPGASLDELKGLIDRFPQLFDVDRCEERWLPFLAQLVGLPFDPRRSAAENRRRIREAVAFYRRKATIPAVVRAATDLGWHGQVEETYRRALRLNRRARLDTARLPGRIWSLGVWRVLSELDAPGLREALAFHHPAGTRVFFLQRLVDALSLEDQIDTPLLRIVRRALLGLLDETFCLGRDTLGSCFHLTRKQKAWGLLQLTTTAALEAEIERADVCLARWHGRGDRMRLNTRPLGQKRLQNCWVSERKFAGCCRVETRKRPPVAPAFMRLAGQDLNRSRLNQADVHCRIRFRQKDFYSDLALEDPTPLGQRELLSFGNESQAHSWFRMSRSRLGAGDTLGGRQRGRSLFLVSIAQDVWVETTAAYDVIDRWRRRGPTFTLNHNALSLRALTDASLTEERASFELTVDTGFPRRRIAEPLRLGRRRLNQAGLRISEPQLRWRFRQKDFYNSIEAGFEAAANRLCITQWPS